MEWQKIIAVKLVHVHMLDLTVTEATSTTTEMNSDQDEKREAALHFDTSWASS